MAISPVDPSKNRALAPTAQPVAAPKPAPTAAPAPAAHKFSIGSVFEDAKNAVKDAAIDVATKVTHVAAEGVRDVVSGLANAASHLPHAVAPDNLWDIVDGNDREDFKKQTEGFRNLLAEVNGAKAKLDAAPAGTPEHAAAQAAFDAASAKLQKTTGYTFDTQPKPGTMWIDPQYESKDAPGGKIDASHLPVKPAVLTPPNPMDVTAGRPQPFKIFGSDGKPMTLDSPEQYKAMIAANRAALGTSRTDSEPIGVQMAFEGGGGKGKRYAPTLSEMYNLGVVPTSVSGNSVGAITAGLLAAGADPVTIDSIVKDPEIKKFSDWDLKDKGGAFNGNFAYQYFDQKLRDITGIHDRPVTFADLKIPLQLVATTMSDSNPPAGKDYSKASDRTFVFSQETTPNTPVALAIQASIAEPGVWDPVQMVDPTTGRELHLVDGGVIDSLPMGYGHNDLPQIGLSLLEMDSNHPRSEDNSRQEQTLPKGNLDVDWIGGNIKNAIEMHNAGAATTKDFHERTDPKAGQFMLNIPVWDLKDPTKQNETLKYDFQPDVDPILDAQSRDITRDFLKQYLGSLTDKTAKGSNVTAKLPENTSFTRPVTYEGKQYTATYQKGSDTVHYQGLNGAESFDVKMGRTNIEAMILDDLSFHDLSAQLAYAKHQDDRPFWEKAFGDLTKGI